MPFSLRTTCSRISWPPGLSSAGLPIANMAVLSPPSPRLKASSRVMVQAPSLLVRYTFMPRICTVPVILRFERRHSSASTPISLAALRAASRVAKGASKLPFPASSLPFASMNSSALVLVRVLLFDPSAALRLPVEIEPAAFAAEPAA